MNVEQIKAKLAEVVSAISVLETSANTLASSNEILAAATSSQASAAGDYSAASSNTKTLVAELELLVNA